MIEQYFLYFMICIQIIVGSLWLPKKLIAFGQVVITRYPKSKYPKLYPYYIDESHIETRMFIFKLLAITGFVGSVFIVLFSAVNGYSQLLNWDNQSVVTMLYLMQVSPLLLLSSMATRYFKLMRMEGEKAVRRAELKPRNLFNFAHPAFIITAAALLLVYAILLVVISYSPFQGFAGVLPNLFGVILINTLFGYIVYRNLYGKREDPYKTIEDRFKENALNIRVMFINSILISLHLSISLIFSWLDQKSWSPIFQVLFFVAMLIIVVLCTRTSDEVDFSVYQ